MAGVAALLWSYQPSAHVDDIQRALLSSAVDLGTPGRDDMSGEGLVNAVNALAVLKGDSPVASVADTEAASVGECSSEELSLEIRIQMDPSEHEISYELVGGTNSSTVMEGSDLVSNELTVVSSCIEASDCYTFTIFDSNGDG